MINHFVKAQDDIHFTQFNWVNTHLNPALAGQIEKGNMDFAVLYRDQSFTVTPNEYRTLIAQVQSKYNISTYGSLGLSGLLSSDRAGDGQLRSDQLGLGSAYKFMIPGTSHILSAGLQGMWIQRRYGDTGAFILEEELQQGTTTESLSNDNYGYLDMNAGIGHEWFINDNSNLLTGIGIHHFNNSLPANSETVIDKYPLRFNFFSQYKRMLNAQLTLIPRIHYQRSSVFTTLQIQTLIRYTSSKRSPYTFSMGAGWRVKDAVQLLLGVQYKSWYIGLAYDNNTSELRAASGNISALELGIRYSYFRKDKTEEPEDIPPVIPESIKPVPIKVIIDKPDDIPNKDIKISISERDSIVTDTLVKDWPFNMDVDPESPTEIVIKVPSFIPDTISIIPGELKPGMGIKHLIDPRKIVEEVPEEKKEEIIEEKSEEIIEEIIYREEPIILENIYYDFDDDTILEESEEEMTHLLKLLNRHPDMIIELSSHTDVRGNDDYNIDLSQRRADSATQWLFMRGIDRDRIVSRGYGETRLINHCENDVPCSEDLHRKNRRTEFKIIAGPTSVRYRISRKTK